MVGEPKGGLGDSGGPFADFNAIELVNVHQGKLGQFIACEGVVLFIKIRKQTQSLEFEPAKLAIRDNEKVSASARGVEKPESRQFLLEFMETRYAAGGSVIPDPVEFGVEVIEKKRADEL